VYVQDRLLEKAKVVNELLQSSGHLYVCGDAATMARAVVASLRRVVAEERGVSEEVADDLIKEMRSSNMYQVRLLEIFFYCF
jgi:NADPH-ferrihemoprotein reductase